MNYFIPLLTIMILYLFICEFHILLFNKIEDFVNVQNTPGINKGEQYPVCPQGFYPYKKYKKCAQLCRGCKTGICYHGYCSSV